nr:hypothetical protein [Lachnospiraceae bacterium]
LTFFIVWKQACDTVSTTDYQSHMMFAKYILNYVRTGQSYFIWHFLVFATFAAGSTLGTMTIEVSCALVTACINLAVYLVIHRVLKKQDVRYAHLFAFVLCIVMPIYLPFYNDRIFLGQGGPVTWHNPTNLMVKPFAIAGFFLLLQLLYQIRNNEKITKSEYISLAVLTFVSVLAKPSYVQGIGPALFILLLLLCIKEKGKYIKQYFCLLLTFAPIVPLILLQFFAAFYNSSDERSGGIGFGWFTPGYGYAPSPYLSSLLVVAFPLLYTLLHYRKAASDIAYPLAWIFVIVSWLENAILYEKGERMQDGNFSWALQLSYTILFVLTVRDFAKDVQDNIREKKKWTIADILPAIVLCCHIISGVIYIYRLLTTNMWV